MRGDFPAGWEGTNGDFSHADGLIGYIRTKFPDFCIAAACYPEKHILAPSFEADIAHLRSKQDNGAEFLMSQLCHDVEAFEAFVYRIREAGITIPVVLGIMPALHKDAIIRMTLSNGCSIPAELAAIIGTYGDDPDEFKKAGIEYTIEPDLQVHGRRDRRTAYLHAEQMGRRGDHHDRVGDPRARVASSALERCSAEPAV